MKRGRPVLDPTFYWLPSCTVIGSRHALPTFTSVAADRCCVEHLQFHSWLSDGCFPGHAETVTFGVKLILFKKKKQNKPLGALYGNIIIHHLLQVLSLSEQTLEQSFSG